jgi:hypothetical protein
MSWFILAGRADDEQSVMAFQIVSALIVAPVWAAAVATMLASFKAMRSARNLNIFVGIIVWLGMAAFLSSWHAVVAHARFSVSPVMITKNNMRRIFCGVDDYFARKRLIPRSLTDIPEAKEAGQDGWGKVLIYSVDSDDTITLLSYGADGKPGGTGLDADIVMKQGTTGIYSSGPKAEEDF